MSKNRTMEAKRIKYIRQSRAKPRILRMNNGHIKVSQSVDKSKIPKDAVSLFHYRDRAKFKSDYVKEAFLNAVLDAMFPNFNPPMIKEREAEHMRLKVNSLEPVERKLLLVNGKYTKVAMVSNRDLTCLQFLEYQVIPGIVRRSITYGSYDRALQVFHLQTIRWNEIIHIPNVESAPLDE